jgi:glycogen debranching enzyme
VNATGVDGFRYDLAPVMGRTEKGFRADAPLLVAIQNDPLLAPLIHIAEPWDVGPGGYQVGNFAADWHEWNDHFRDDVRRFWRGDAGAAGKFATRLAGSSDVFEKGDARPSRSINFVAAHDGFALSDVVRFNAKHNHANGENNRDGSDGEVCWIDEAPVEKVKAMLASLFFARGTIMMTAGDEFGRTQRGNNNAYAQDNEVTWRDWVAADQSLIEYVGTLAKLRESYRAYFDDEFLRQDDIIWFGADGQALSHNTWANTNVVGMAVRAEGKAQRLAVVFSRKSPARKVALPIAQDGMNWNAIELASTHCAVYIESR